jgi:hypothetical protein
VRRKLALRHGYIEPLPSGGLPRYFSNLEATHKVPRIQPNVFSSDTMLCFLKQVFNTQASAHWAPIVQSNSVANSGRRLCSNIRFICGRSTRRVDSSAGSSYSAKNATSLVSDPV